MNNQRSIVKEKTCRICWEGTNFLNEYCLCQSFHQECLSEWIKVVQQKHPERVQKTTSNRSKYICEICKQVISFQTLSKTKLKLRGLKEIWTQGLMKCMLFMLIPIFAWVFVFLWIIQILSRTLLADVWAICFLALFDAMPIPFYVFYFFIEREKIIKIHIQKQKIQFDQESQKQIFIPWSSEETKEYSKKNFQITPNKLKEQERKALKGRNKRKSKKTLFKKGAQNIQGMK